jgi:hypothetical protein
VLQHHRGAPDMPAARVREHAENSSRLDLRDVASGRRP